MEINSLDGQTTLVAHLSKNDVKFFEKNPFGNISTKANNKGIKIIFSLGKEKSVTVKERIISLTIPREGLTLLSERKENFFRLSKNRLGISTVEIYLNLD